MKTCITCNEEKELTEFYRRNPNGTIDGYMNKCKKCKRAQSWENEQKRILRGDGPSWKKKIKIKSFDHHHQKFWYMSARIDRFNFKISEITR